MAGLSEFLSIPQVIHRAIRFQPVFVGDVGAAITRILGDSSTVAGTYELGGPETMSLQRLYSFLRKERPRSPLKSAMWMAEVEATILDQEPDRIWRFGKAPNSSRVLDSPTEDSKNNRWRRRDHVVDPKALGLADLGIKPTPVEAAVRGYTGHDRPGTWLGPKY